MIYKIIFAFLLAILLSLVLYYALRNKGPWNNIWLTFIFIFLGIWAASLWISPIGPVYMGVAWVPLFFVGIILMLIIASGKSPTRDDWKKKEVKMDPRKEPAVISVSIFFWIMLLILMIIIVLGYN